MYEKRKNSFATNTIEKSCFSESDCAQAWSSAANKAPNGEQIKNTDGTAYKVVASEAACKQHCIDTATCNGYVFYPTLKRCWAKSGVTALVDTTEPKRYSGFVPLDCPDTTTSKIFVLNTKTLQNLTNLFL